MKLEDIKLRAVSLRNKLHPEWGTFGVMDEYVKGLIWNIHGRAGWRTLSVSELGEWEVA